MEEKETITIEGLTPERIKEVENKMAELKAANPKKRIFPLAVEGDPDFDEKDVYIGYFKQPSFVEFSKYLAASQKDQAVAMRTLARDCFLDGDRALIDDDSLFLFGLMGQLSEIIKMRQGKLVNLSKAGK
jgi:hypothetical protein